MMIIIMIIREVGHLKIKVLSAGCQCFMACHYYTDLNLQLASVFLHFTVFTNIYVNILHEYCYCSHLNYLLNKSNKCKYITPLAGCWLLMFCVRACVRACYILVGTKHPNKDMNS